MLLCACVHIQLAIHRPDISNNNNSIRLFSPRPQAPAAGQGAADEPPAAQPAPADPPAPNDAEPEPPDVPPDQGDEPELEEEEGAAAEDADPNNGAQGWNLRSTLVSNIFLLVVTLISAEQLCEVFSYIDILLRRESAQTNND